jgi:hypothetical protein
MKTSSLLLLAAVALFSARARAADEATKPSTELIYVDSAGVLRWRTSNVEVAMLGANYCLPSASDYRAAGAVHADRKKLIDQDMTHFARMGWDSLRLSFWGDWECCDRDGNLIANDHLDLLDYLIYRAKARDLHMMLSPIVTYSSMWPGADDPTAVGFSRYYKKEELGTNPQAIAAQANYLRQMLNHVNPYTHLALKDEPYICYVELINEPAQHPEDFAGSVRYINALVDAVRSTGCKKVTFFNFSQDFAMAQALAASKVDGISFALYPSGLVAGHQLQGNFLRTVDNYAPMLAPEVAGKPRVVYEYDMPDVMSGYHYPAMVRTFRSVGAQSATMFSYDMLATAPYNLGWQTHCLNMVYTPQKAASAIIASQVMRRIPRMAPVPAYPENTRFGDFRVSYEENLSELVATDAFYYSNNTKSTPKAPDQLKRIVGFGSSPVVRYEGVGLYFLDKISEGTWRLEVYPDSLQIDDPFAPDRTDRPVFKLIAREWPMSVDLPDLGSAFAARPLDPGNSFVPNVQGKEFGVRPGVYLLTRAGVSATAAIPDRLPGLPYYLGMREFVCPPTGTLSTSIIVHAAPEFPSDAPIRIGAMVAANEEPKSVLLTVLPSAGSPLTIPMHRSSGYNFEVELAPGTVPPGAFKYTVAVQEGDGTRVFPQDSPVASLRAPEFSSSVVKPSAPLDVFTPASDTALLSVSRSGEARNKIPKPIPGSVEGSEAYPLEYPTPAMAEDFTASLYIGDRVASRGPALASAKSLRIRLKGLEAPSVIRVTLVEKDGSAWTRKVFASQDWQDVEVPLASLQIGKSAMVPQAYPGTWSYWLSSPPGRTAINLPEVERIQFSLRQADFGTIQSVGASRSSVAIESASLQY